MKHGLVALAAVATLFVASTASAQYGYGPPPPRPYYAPPPAWSHNGLYLRAAIGGGYMHDSFGAQGANGYGTFALDAAGASGSAEFAIGGSLRPGLNLALALFIESVQGPNITAAGIPTSSNIQVGTLAMLGPMIDWYPRPRHWGGWHLEGALAGARMTLSDNAGNVVSQTPVGGGFEAGLGYEFGLAPKFGLGVLARVVGAQLVDGSYNHTVEAASLLLTGTYN